MHTDDLRHHERTTRLLLAALALWILLGSIGLVWVVNKLLEAIGIWP